MSFPALIEAACLRKAYGARLAIDNLTFSVNAGEVVGLGPTGAGKTTTLSILATLITPMPVTFGLPGSIRAWLLIVWVESLASYRPSMRSIRH